MRLTTGLKVLMAHKKDIVYYLGRSKSVTPSQRMIGTFDDERDPEYVPPGAMTTTPDARESRATYQKVVCGVVTAFQSDEERTLTSTPSRSALGIDGASSSEAASGFGLVSSG